MRNATAVSVLIFLFLRAESPLRDGKMRRAADSLRFSCFPGHVYSLIHPPPRRFPYTGPLFNSPLFVSDIP